MKKRYGAAMNCIDGRIQIPVIQWVKKNFNVDYVDLITEPGMDKVLSQGNEMEIGRLKRNLEISIAAHDARVVVVSGHDGCAANPVNDAQHIKDIRESVAVVRSWRLPIHVVGIWVDGRCHIHVVSKDIHNC